VRLRALLRKLVEALFKVLFTYDSVGEERIPAIGGAVVAANHPSYLDPILLSLQVSRPIRFMAWDALFKVPLIGALLRLFGAFPVDVGRGKGREAYAKAKALVESGEVVGIFPEGKRSRTAWMEVSLREGAARLAWETGKPLVPATIAGAYRAWPHFQALPRPARIRVRFHEPIDPAPYRALPEEEALSSLLAELRHRVERSLLPSVKRDLRLSLLYRRASSWPRWHELVPLLALPPVLARAPWTLAVVPAAVYTLYLLLDRLVIPQSLPVKWIRSLSPVIVVVTYGLLALAEWNLPPLPASGALFALLAGALFPYLYERGTIAAGALSGLVSAVLLEMVATWLAPTSLGPHISLPVFLMAYAWEGRTVFWPYVVIVLGAYAAAVPLVLGGGVGLTVHALAGLLAWMLIRLFPYHRTPGGGCPVWGLGLRLDT
jgi:1-acyl-sn-glycerol-3-phosphate acyltransferase